MIDFEAKFSQTLIEMEKVGTEYAEAKAQSWQLQEMRKVMLAKLQKNILTGSEAAKEKEALRSCQYEQHINGTKEAISKELTSRAKYEKLKATYEALRSLCAQETAKIKLL